jgi:acyl-CoA thioester hydrolase
VTSITVHRRVAWNETDAAGHNHFSAAFRWLEEAEHDLLRLIGFDNNLIDRIPRVHIEIDYSARLYFGEEIAVTVTVVKVGTTSATLSMLVTHDGGKEAVKASYVVVNASSTTQGSASWTPETRELLAGQKHFEVAAQATSIG